MRISLWFERDPDGNDRMTSADVDTEGLPLASNKEAVTELIADILHLSRPAGIRAEPDPVVTQPHPLAVQL